MELETAVEKHKFLLPAVYCDYQDFLNPASAYKAYHFNQVLKDHVMFHAALKCCTRKSGYRYETNIYPVYLILKKCLTVFPNLEFVEFQYESKL